LKEVEVKITNNKVSVLLVDEGIYLRKDGEEIFEYFDEFWDWLKEKIGEDFIVVLKSDKKEKIPSFIKIKTTQKEFNVKSDLIDYFLRKKSLLRKKGD